MAVLQANNDYWIDVELGTRILARILDCIYVPYPLGSKVPMKQPAPSSPTEKHLYMLLPHAIGIYPPAQNFDLVVVATISALTFFGYALEKLGMELGKPPILHEGHFLILIDSSRSRGVNHRRQLVFGVHYCRIPHEYGHHLSDPERIPPVYSKTNRDMLARLHDSRYIVKKVRRLDTSADITQPHAPSSIEYRACISQLICWAFSCGILCPRLEMLSSEMIVFCVDQAYADLDIRETDTYMWRSTVAKLIEKCMYPKLIGLNAESNQLCIPTPSGRRLGHSANGKDISSAAIDTIKRAIMRDMTSVNKIAMGDIAGEERFKGEHEVYLKVIVRCWDPQECFMLCLNFYSVLASMSERVMELYEGAVKTRIWPLITHSTVDVPIEAGWIAYIGLSENIVERNMNFVHYARETLDDKALRQLAEICMEHKNFNRRHATVEIQLRSQAELFGNEVAPNTGLNMDDGINFEAILGVEGLPITKVSLGETENDVSSEALPDEPTIPEKVETETEAETSKATSSEPHLPSITAAGTPTAGLNGLGVGYNNRFSGTRKLGVMKQRSQRKLCFARQ